MNPTELAAVQAVAEMLPSLAELREQRERDVIDRAYTAIAAAETVLAVAAQFTETK